MRAQAGQNVMAVLPYALSNDQRHVRVELAKHFHPHLLRINEPVLLDRVKAMTSHKLAAFPLQSVREDALHPRLFRPGLLIGTQAQIAISHQINLSAFESLVCFHAWAETVAEKQKAESRKLKLEMLALNGHLLAPFGT